MATSSRVAGPSVRGTNQQQTVTTVTFSSSYSTGGEAVTFADLGFVAADFAYAICTPTAASAGAVANAVYDATNQKLKALTSTAEVANATNLSAVTVQVVAFSK